LTRALAVDGDVTVDPLRRPVGTRAADTLPPRHDVPPGGAGDLALMDELEFAAGVTLMPDECQLVTVREVSTGDAPRLVFIGVGPDPARAASFAPRPALCVVLAQPASWMRPFAVLGVQWFALRDPLLEVIPSHYRSAGGTDLLCRTAVSTALFHFALTADAGHVSISPMP